MQTNRSFSQVDSLKDRNAFQRARDLVADVSDVRAEATSDRFHASVETVHMGTGLLLEHRSSPIIYDRTVVHVARSALDHYMIHLPLDGGYQVESRHKTARPRYGDIVVLDMTQASKSYQGASGDTSVHALTFLMPRSALSPALAAPDSIHSHVISAQSRPGALLRETMLSACRDARSGTIDGQSITDAAIGLIASSVGSRAGCEESVARSFRKARFDSILRHIERHLDQPELGPDQICKAHNVSRATLYRLFEPYGGLVQHIQQRRLHRAFKRLISPKFRGQRILDIALDACFSSDSTFVRAFRSNFGLTPGEIRIQGTLNREFKAAETFLQWMGSL